MHWMNAIQAVVSEKNKEKREQKIQEFREVKIFRGTSLKHNITATPHSPYFGLFNSLSKR